MRFFTIIAAVLTVIAVSLGAVVVEEFVRTGLVPRLPTAVLAASIQIVAFICLTAGLILESVCRSRREARRLVYLGLEAVSPDLASARPAGEVGRVTGIRRSDRDHGA